MQNNTGSTGGKFYFFVVLFCALIIFAGFAPSYYLKSVLNAPPPLSPLTMTHGLVYTAWTLLFVAQAGLIAFGRSGMHRQLGVVGAVLFGAVATVGISTAITGARLGHSAPGAPEPLAFLVLPLSAIAGAIVLVILALLFRRQREHHKRLMLPVIFLMAAPAIDRLLFMAGMLHMRTQALLAITDSILVAVIAYDAVKTKRMHPAYLWAAAVFAVIDIAVWWGYASPQWLPVAEWLTRG